MLNTCLEYLEQDQTDQFRKFLADKTQNKEMNGHFFWLLLVQYYGRYFYKRILIFF